MQSEKTDMFKSEMCNTTKATKQNYTKCDGWKFKHIVKLLTFYGLT